MSKKEKKVSIRAMDEVVKRDYHGTLTDEWRGIEVTVTKTISLTDMMEFVNNVVGSCFLDDGRYLPEIKEFAVKSNLLAKYTNIALPEKLEHRYELLYCSDIVDFVRDVVSEEQLREIEDAIDRKIAYRCATETAAVQRQLAKLADAFSEVQKTASGLFDSVSADDLKKLVGALSEDGGVNEEKIVSAYLRQKDEPIEVN